jgi:hypothetical protein
MAHGDTVRPEEDSRQQQDRRSWHGGVRPQRRRCPSHRAECKFLEPPVGPRWARQLHHAPSNLVANAAAAGSKADRLVPARARGGTNRPPHATDVVLGICISSRSSGRDRRPGEAPELREVEPHDRPSARSSLDPDRVHHAVNVIPVLREVMPTGARVHDQVEFPLRHGARDRSLGLQAVLE